MSVERQLMMSSGGVQQYTISNSLRFRASASAYLSRTPASAGNRKTFTFSAWLKRGELGANYAEFYSSGDSAGNGDAFNFNVDKLDVYFAGGTSYRITTNSVYRDPSAWYHIVISIDTTQSTANNRVKIYVNGTQATANGSYPPQNYDCSYFNTTTAQLLGAGYTYFDGYLTEINFIDGQALTPSSFGETSSTTGVWIPKKYTGSYGTNGFYLNFSNNTSTTALGYDTSGNGNNWTPNNFSLTTGATYDSMIDSPTSYASGTNNVGNYSVINSLSTTNATISNAGLTGSLTGAGGYASSFDGLTSGKWYWELTYDAAVSNFAQWVGALSSAYPNNNNAWGYGSQFALYASDGRSGVTGAAYGASWSTGDVIGVALDLSSATGTCSFYKNGVSQGVLANALVSSAGWRAVATGGTSGIQSTLNFGQRPFAYTPPSGYKSLCTYNLPTPTIQNGAGYMAATLYTGTGATNLTVANANNSVSFQPGFVWIKKRGPGTANHCLNNEVMGVGTGVSLYTASTSVAGAYDIYGYLSALTSTGFTTQKGTDPTYPNDLVNESGSTYVAWQWKAGGTAVTNTAGSITSSVSANTTAGFSVVTYTGNGVTTATVGHGLGVAPSMVIVKARALTTDWQMYLALLGPNYTMQLNATGGPANYSSYWYNGGTSSTFGVNGTYSGINGNGSTYVAYCFAAIPGYSAFGSYTGNGSTDGPFTYTGFRPRYLMIKRTDTAGGSWVLHDSSRDPYNGPDNKELYAESSAAEATNGRGPDLLSNGFKQRNTTFDYNASGGTYIYAAFAENPFKYSLAR